MTVPGLAENQAGDDSPALALVALKPSFRALICTPHDAKLSNKNNYLQRFIEDGACWYGGMARGTIRAAMQDAATSTKHFSWPVRVYYEDTDIAGVVYYANYLRFFERARTEWLRAAGFEQTDLAAQHQVVFVVRNISVDYLLPARFNDALQVSVELVHAGASQIKLNQCVMRGDERLCEATVRIACVGLPAMKPVRIPAPLAEKLHKP
jgi:acyl-CoA thioester hydrolase